MKYFTWLHLSDFHIKDAADFAKDTLFSQLLDEIQEQCAPPLVPDVILFSGDIAFSGQSRQYDVAAERFDALLKACGLDGQRDRLFIVPGNHDVDRSRIPTDCKTIRRDVLGNLEERYEEIDDYLQDEIFRKRLLQRFGGYEQFANRYWIGDDRYDGRKTAYSYCVPIELDGVGQVAIVGLNSAWISQEDNEQGRLFLGRHQVNNAIQELERIAPKARLRIALMHHPLYWLAEEDMTGVEPLLAEQCSTLLHGHLHCPRMTLHSDPDLSLQVMAAGASFESRAKLNAYNIVRIDLESGAAEATVRIQHPRYSPNWGHDTITYRRARGGKFTFPVRLF